MNVLQALILLDKLLMIAERAPAIYERVFAIKRELEEIGERELTEAEWEEVGQSIDSRLDRIKQQL